MSGILQHRAIVDTEDRAIFGVELDVEHERFRERVGIGAGFLGVDVVYVADNDTDHNFNGDVVGGVPEVGEGRGRVFGEGGIDNKGSRGVFFVDTANEFRERRRGITGDMFGQFRVFLDAFKDFSLFSRVRFDADNERLFDRIVVV